HKKRFTGQCITLSAGCRARSRHIRQRPSYSPAWMCARLESGPGMTGDFEMKKILFAAVAVVALTALPAAAADLGPRYYNKTPAYVAPIWTWTGFYVGAHLGGALGTDNNFNGLAVSTNSARFLGGVQAGADWQFSGNWVVGAEGQYSFLSKNSGNTVFPGGYIYGNDQRGLGSITARVGYSFGPALVYVKGGYA